MRGFVFVLFGHRENWRNLRRDIDRTQITLKARNERKHGYTRGQEIGPACLLCCLRRMALANNVDLRLIGPIRWV